MDRPGDQLAALVDLVCALDAAAVAYALIGGIAVGIHSSTPRATMDVDIAVATSVPRDSVRDALQSAGFVFRGEFPHSMNFRHTSGEPVQVAFDATFDAMIERAEEVDVVGTRIRIVTKDDLITMKELAAHDPARRRSKALRDQADVALLRDEDPNPDEGW